MTISSYLFQSPYTQPFQIGRPDPAMLEAKQEETQQQQSAVQANAVEAAQANEAYGRSRMAIKSSVSYANSEGAGLSSDQIQQLSAMALQANRSAYVNTYAQNGSDSYG